MKIYHYILLAIGVLALGLLSEGCSSRSSDEPQPDRGEFCELVISLSSETSVTDTPATRADDQPWGEPYPDFAGFPSEYYIDFASFYFVTDNNSVIPFTPTLAGRDANTNTVTYKATIDVRSWYVNHAADGSMSMSGRIVAVANYPDGYTPASPFQDIPFKISDVDSRKRMPMWGVTRVNNLPLVVDRTVDAGQIKMLRAVPKITIELADKFKDLYNIMSVVPDQPGSYPALGNCVPEGALTANKTGDLMIEGCFNHLPGTQYTDPKFQNAGNSSVWCYLAERTCPADAGTPLSFTVTLAEKDNPKRNFTGKVYLCDYVDGKPDFNTAFRQLVRNHDYQYKISLKELEFVISFKEWIFGGKVHIELE